MELRHLRYFVAVAEEQNVTRAAARLHVSQPSLSRQIRDLEDELNVALFDHRAKAVRLTKAGRVFLDEVRTALERTEQAVKVAKTFAREQQTEINIAYAPSLSVDLLPRTLRLFQKASPTVRVQLHDLSTEEMLRGLRDGKMHAAMWIQLPAKVMTGLAFEELYHYAVCVALPSSHSLARARKIGLEQVVNERLIALTLADYPEYHTWLAKLFEAVKPPVRVAEEYDSVTSIITAVEAGRGVALVSERLDCLAGHRLKIRRLEPAPPPIVVGITYRKEVNSAATVNFIAAAKRAMAG
jgi:DNA-binding transcriptional LysR family regulator